MVFHCSFTRFRLFIPMVGETAAILKYFFCNFREPASLLYLYFLQKFWQNGYLRVIYVLLRAVVYRCGKSWICKGFKFVYVPLCSTTFRYLPRSLSVLGSCAYFRSGFPQTLGITVFPELKIYVFSLHLYRTSLLFPCYDFWLFLLMIFELSFFGNLSISLLFLYFLPKKTQILKSRETVVLQEVQVVSTWKMLFILRY